MTNNPPVPKWHFYLLVILLTNISGFLLNLFSLPETLFILGFRLHSFSLSVFVLAILYQISILQIFDFRKFKPGLIWQFIFYLVFISLILYSLFYLKLLKYTDPDFMVELGASSLIDLPLYFIWLSPLFFSFYFWYSKISDLRGGNYTSYLIGVLPFLYTAIDYKTLQILPLPFLYVITCGAFFTVAAKSKNFYFFYFWAYIPLWIYLLAFGTESINLLQTLLAKQYDEWEGLFAIKGKIDGFKFFIFYAFCLVLLLISLFSNRKFLFKGKS